MLPPFEAILFDYDGTLAVLNLDFAAMRRHLHAFTVAQGISPQELQHLRCCRRGYRGEIVGLVSLLRRRHEPQNAETHWNLWGP